MLISMMRVLAVALLFAVPRAALAQTPPPAQPASAPAQQQMLNDAQLDALLAPIALYPDALLSEVLMASTYPLEVVEADRWVDANKNLKGDALKAALDKQSWDDSVKSLTATPDVLDMMSNQLSWTQQLGDAVLAQQPDVMDSIQRLRTKAQANNKLASNQQQTVTTQQQGGQQIIAIAPTDPDTLYVPYYDPSVVYGAWPYADYPAYPYYWPPPGDIAGGVIATGIAFGAGYALGRWVSNGNRWGGGFNWGNNNINVNRTVNNIGNNNNWTHNPAHRQGVRYNNANVAAKFGGNGAAIAGGAQNRIDFRGRSGQQVLNPGAGAGAGANRPGGGGAGAGAGANRPGGGAGAGANRPGGGGGGNAANRPSGGGANRPSGGGANRPSGGGAATARPAARPSGGGAMGNISSGRAANVQSARGAQSLGGGGGPRGGGGGGGAARGGGGGARGGGGGGGGRRSDIRLKHDIVLIGYLDNGLGLYRFVYNGETKPYVGLMAQEVQTVRPDAVTRGADGYLRVYYDRLGLKFESYDAWLASGGRMPVVAH
jgi:hypothetical protein